MTIRPLATASALLVLLGIACRGEAPAEARPTGGEAPPAQPGGTDARAVGDADDTRGVPLEGNDGRARDPSPPEVPGAGTGTASDGSLPDVARRFLAAHDAVRAAARPRPSPAMPPLRWDPQLAALAQGWADRCPREHRDQSRYGENMYFAGGLPPERAPEAAVDAWASEAGHYDYETTVCERDGVRAWYHCGHYTQVVWRDTARIGCGVRTDCRGGMSTVVVCNYDPPGNMNADDVRIPRPY